jgi:hypothetical protein
VWEITEGSTPSSSLAELGLGGGGVGVVVGLLAELGLGVLGLVLKGVLGLVLVLLGVVLGVGVGGFGIIVALGVLGLGGLGLDTYIESGSFTGVLRGGAFDTPSDQATCFFRKGHKKAAHNVGFRCVKEERFHATALR